MPVNRQDDQSSIAVILKALAALALLAAVLAWAIHGLASGEIYLPRRYGEGRAVSGLAALLLCGAATLVAVKPLLAIVMPERVWLQDLLKRGLWVLVASAIVAMFLGFDGA